MEKLRENFENSFWATALMGLILLVLLSATAYRTYSRYSMPSREFDWGGRGMSDFHNGTYYPSLAFREGVVPYSLEAEDKYLLARAAPPYHPFVFIWHQPFTWLEVAASDVVFFIYNFGLLVLLAWLAIRLNGARPSWFMLLLLTNVLLLSRPGHVTMFTGYFTLELVVGCTIAIGFARSHPWLAGIGILFAAGKPTFVLPLLILLLCRRNFKAVAWGLGFSVLLGLAGLMWLASHSSMEQVFNGIREGQQALHEDVTEIPINTWTRTDLVGMIAKPFDWRPGDSVYLTAMFFILLVPGWRLWRFSGTELSRNVNVRPSFGIDGFVIVSSILLSIYHHSYDCLLLFVPWAGVAFYGGKDCGLSLRRRMIVVALGSVVLLNYLSTQMIRDWVGWEQTDAVWQWITMINGAAIFGVMLVLLAQDWGSQHGEPVV